MGQLIDFFAGDPDAIGGALSEGDWDRLRDPQQFPLHVDFSLHLSPVDFDLMTEEAQRVVGKGPASLEASLERQVGGDGAESSADVVSAAWVEMIGSVPSDRVGPLAVAWAEALAKEYSDPRIKVTEDMRDALSRLVALCREAHDRGLPVVQTWAL